MDTVWNGKRRRLVEYFFAMYFFIARRCNVIRRCLDVSRSFSSKNKKSSEDIELPPEPTTCCMSGCANCVWIAYAEELSKLYQGNSDKARDIILNKISDPSLKMFLSVELKFIEDRAKDKVEP